MSNKISDMDSKVQMDAMKLDQAWTDSGIPHQISETRRIQIQQVALWAQGRMITSDVNMLRRLAGYAPIPDAENKYTVTNADGVIYLSNHQSGRALDAQPLVAVVDASGKLTMRPTWDYTNGFYKKMQDTAKSLGWKCGVDFPSPDPDHFEKLA